MLPRRLKSGMKAANQFPGSIKSRDADIARMLHKVGYLRHIRRRIRKNRYPVRVLRRFPGCNRVGFAYVDHQVLILGYADRTGIPSPDIGGDVAVPHAPVWRGIVPDAVGAVAVEAELLGRVDHIITRPVVLRIRADGGNGGKMHPVVGDVMVCPGLRTADRCSIMPKLVEPDLIVSGV